MKKALIFLLACSSLSACQPQAPTHTQLPLLYDLVARFAPGTRRIESADFGAGSQTPASLIVKLALPESGFRTQQSAPGNAGKTRGNILSLRVFLYNSAGPVAPGPLSVANILGPVTLTPNISGGPPFEQNFLVTNVPAGSYYVGVAAFEHASTFTPATNILHPTAQYSYNEGLCYLSNGGGEFGSGSPGRVTVGPAASYVVTGTPQLTLTLRLQDEKGAKLDSKLSVIGGTYLFTSDTTGDKEIMVIRPDGSNIANLSSQAGSQQFNPVPKDDFTKLVYISDQNISNRLYTMNLDGSSQNQITNPVGSDTDGEPVWQPTGSMIAFTRMISGFGEIYTVPGSGGSNTNLTNTATENDRQPSWGSTGLIAFTSDRPGNDEIYTMTSAGLSQTRLTNNTFVDREPIWSPDGSKIAFVSERDGNPEIYVMDSNGSNQLRLTNSSGNDGSPRWSPDNSKIVFVSNRDGGDGDIFVIHPDGSGETQLTQNGSNENQPRWTSDGQIVYTRSNGPSTDIYLMTASGSAERPVTAVGGSFMAGDPVYVPSP